MLEMIDILADIKRMMYCGRPRKNVVACLAMATTFYPHLRDCAGDFGYFELLPLFDEVERRRK